MTGHKDGGHTDELQALKSQLLAAAADVENKDAFCSTFSRARTTLMLSDNESRQGHSNKPTHGGEVGERGDGASPYRAKGGLGLPGEARRHCSSNRGLGLAFSH